MPAITPGTSLHKVVDTIRQAISDVFSQALGSTWSVAIAEDDSVGSSEGSLLCFQFGMSGGLVGTVAMQARNSDVLLWAQKFLAEEANPSAEFRPDHKEAFEELLRQVAGLVATGIKSTWGETKIDVQSSEAPAWEGIMLSLSASETSVGALPLRFRLSSELLASLSSSPSSAAPAPAKSEEKTTSSSNNEPNFDLLLGVDLNLTLRFGQCAMTLRELLDLNSGSVIELDREVTEPADLLLGDKLIARGEVVIVDGNYGIRITEVADPRQRLSTI